MLQLEALLKTAEATPLGYWPNGTKALSLQALGRRGLVTFIAGRGWHLTEAGRAYCGIAKERA